LNPWDEMKRLVDLGEADKGRLEALLTLAEPAIERIGRSLPHTQLARVFSDRTGSKAEDEGQETVEGAFRRYTRELLTGPYDQAWWLRRQAVGRMCAQLGVPERYLFFVVHRLRVELTEAAFAAIPPAEAIEMVKSLHRILDADLAVFAASFRRSHEASRLRSMQEALLRSLPVTVLGLDASGRVTSATHVEGSIFAKDAQIGQHYEAFLPSDLVEAADLPTQLGRALATQAEVTIPRIVSGKGGSARNFRVRIVPIDNEITPVLLHLEDITDIVQAEIRVQQAENLARIGSLAANVAHEIRNPLTAISTTMQVIGASLDAHDPRKSVVLKVQGQVVRLDRLVTDLLSYARPARPNLRPIALEAPSQEAIALSGLRVIVEVIDRQPVLADPQAIQHIVLNLLQNAREAAGMDGRILLRIGPGPTLLIADDGPGVAAEVADRLFDPFVSTKAKGTGLGLAISRKLAESMRGTLEIEPVSPLASSLPPGRGPGAAFRLTLPASLAAGHASRGDSAGRSD
jgi:signal transduction histidine kinase